MHAQATALPFPAVSLIFEDGTVCTLEEHPDGIRLVADDGCEIVTAVFTPQRWAEHKIAGDRILRRRR